MLKRGIWFILGTMFWVTAPWLQAQDTTLTITSDGKVGIGITLPKALLHVDGDLLVNTGRGNFYLRTGSGQYGWWWGTANGGRTLIIGPTSAAGDESGVIFIDRKGMSIGGGVSTEALEVNGNIKVTGMVDSVDVSELKKQVDARRSRFKSFYSLNEASVDVGNTWTKLKTADNFHVFTKKYDETYIEVFVNSRVSVETLTGIGIFFQVRLNGQEPTWETRGSMKQASPDYFLSFMGVFKGLPAGNYNVEIWAKVTGSGNATKVLFDPVGLRGGIVVKETW